VPIGVPGFPSRRRESERQLKKASQSSQAQIPRGCRLAGKKGRQKAEAPPPARVEAPRAGPSGLPGRCGSHPGIRERIGLILPTPDTKAARITVQVMLRFLMIQERRFQPGFPFRSRHNELWPSEPANKSRKIRPRRLTRPSSTGVARTASRLMTRQLEAIEFSWRESRFVNSQNTQVARQPAFD